MCCKYIKIVINNLNTFNIFYEMAGIYVCCLVVAVKP